MYCGGGGLAVVAVTQQNLRDAGAVFDLGGVQLDEKPLVGAGQHDL